MNRFYETVKITVALAGIVNLTNELILGLMVLEMEFRDGTCMIIKPNKFDIEM